MQTSNLIPVEEENQTQLFSSDDFEAGVELVATLESKPDTARRTGRTLERRRGLVKQIIDRVASGMSSRAVAEMFGVSRQSIRMLVERAEERGEVEPIRKRIAHKFFTVAELSAEEMRRRLEEEPEKVKFQELSFGSQVTTTQGSLLTGSATSITAKVTVDQSAVTEKLAEIKKAVIDV